jgi:hypothetical protein
MTTARRCQCRRGPAPGACRAARAAALRVLDPQRGTSGACYQRHCSRLRDKCGFCPNDRDTSTRNPAGGHGNSLSTVW